MQTNVSALAGASMCEHFRQPSLLLVLFVLSAVNATHLLVEKYREYCVRPKLYQRTRRTNPLILKSSDSHWSSLALMDVR
jgi:hypothetical protein